MDCSWLNLRWYHRWSISAIHHCCARRIEFLAWIFPNNKSWIADCETHPRCKLGYVEDSKLPMRGINIRISYSSVRLIETKDAIGRFAALGNCLRDPMILKDIKLSRAEFSDYQKKIPIEIMESLPKALFDAVMITRGLRIPYLWVDFLCIIQDSSIDRQIEGPWSIYIYMCVCVDVLNFRGHGSKRFYWGSFPEKGIKSIRLPYIDADDRQHFSLYSIIQGQFSFHDANGRLGSHGLHDSELRRHWWVLQEQVLARRTVSFTKDETLWDRMECNTSECRTGFLIFEPATNFLDTHSDAKRQFSPSREIYKIIYVIWNIMVDSHTRLIIYPPYLW